MHHVNVAPAQWSCHASVGVPLCCLATCKAITFLLLLWRLQGAFVLLGTTPGGAGIAVLLVMMIALLCYIAWRFGEAFLGQGYDAG
jgi:hypothetical protein